MAQRLEADPTAVELDCTDANVVCYITGALVRSLLRVTKGCISCKGTLLDPNQTDNCLPHLSVEGSLRDESITQLIQQVSLQLYITVS